MADIKLFVCCHQPMEVPKHPLLVPIQVGAALADSHFPGFLYDDTGDNISAKNGSYCELTAQYWAWKNADADYYGFFHYRRYLYPDKGAKRPYRINRIPSLELLKRLDYDKFEELIQQYDLILPKSEAMGGSVKHHYINAAYHHQEDFERIEKIITIQYPEMVQAAKTYFNEKNNYFGNIYIMSKPVFYNYCNWLFSILQEFDSQADTARYSPQELRVDGYLSERLLGVYRTYYQNDLKILELPRVHFYSGTEYVWRKVVNALLPPGSQRRAYIKGMSQCVFYREKE